MNFGYSLLKEAKPINMEDPDSSTEQLKPPLSVDLPDPISVEDRQLLGRSVLHEEFNSHFPSAPSICVVMD